jgi:hypothetical protein
MKNESSEKPDVLDTDQALREEYEYFWGADPDIHTAEDRRRAFYEKSTAALCLSGGGIRSAAFALGVVQALSRKGLLSHFHYMSTVSGGGYCGSFLSRWLREYEHNVDRLQKELARDDPAPVRWLREYSNFITPRVGLASMDTWTALALSVRNILLNWLVFGPALLILMAVPNLYLLAAVLAADWWGDLAIVSGLILMSFATWRACHELPGHTKSQSSASSSHELAGSRKIFRTVSLPALIAALLLPIGIASTCLSLQGSFIAPQGYIAGLAVFVSGSQEAQDVYTTIALIVSGGFFLSLLLGYLLAARSVPGRRRGFRENAHVWCLSALVATVMFGTGIYWANKLPEDIGRSYPEYIPLGSKIDLICILGPVWVVVSQVLLISIYAGFRRIDRQMHTSPDLDREWLARISAQKVRLTVLWLIFTGVALLLPRIIIDATAQAEQGTASVLALLSGIVAVWGGKSSASKVGSAVVATAKTIAMDKLVAVATFIFAVALIVLFARIELDLASYVSTLIAENPGRSDLARAHFIVLALLGALLAVTSRSINVNRFSLNGMYRNRLSRAFLGAARNRNEEPFTGFDPEDNIRMHLLRVQDDQVPRGNRAHNRRLFHVINVALNVVGGKRLSWQERKAEPFTITPLHCGSAELRAQPKQLKAPGAYVHTREYGGDEADYTPGKQGISLATAMAISGAAASPSMGYHSSPATAFLMTLFNVRLGAWMPNPGSGELSKPDMLKSGPRNALRPLMAEMAGLTDDQGFNIYLSDGGHFENLGLYEMIRRRCRYIVISDAGADPECSFEDLGNAVRKVMIDQDGVEINFQRIDISSRKNPLADQFAFALGTVRYTDPGKEEQKGIILYIKPSYFGRMPVEIRAYAEANAAFPHEPTADQWFSESQFESYRRLGEFLTSGLGAKASYAEGGLEAFFADVERQIKAIPSSKKHRNFRPSASVPKRRQKFRIRSLTA